MLYLSSSSLKSLSFINSISRPNGKESKATATILFECEILKQRSVFSNFGFLFSIIIFVSSIL